MICGKQEVINHLIKKKRLYKINTDGRYKICSSVRWVNSNLEGGWVMRAEDIKGLTPKEIQAKFALEYEPIFIVK